MKKLHLRVTLIAGASIAMLMSGCATKTGTGAAIGAGSGALIGQAVGGSTGATVAGAAIGGITGAAIGNSQEKKQAMDSTFWWWCWQNI